MPTCSILSILMASTARGRWAASGNSLARLRPIARAVRSLPEKDGDDQITDLSTQPPCWRLSSRGAACIVDNASDALAADPLEHTEGSSGITSIAQALRQHEGILQRERHTLPGVRPDRMGGVTNET